jgi:signal transduction histidine kinase
VSTSPATTAPPADQAGVTAARPALRRPSEGRLLAGVAAGLAEHLALDVLRVRVALAVLSVLAGFGVALYAALWVFVPVDRPVEDAAGLASAARTGRRPSRANRRGDVGQLVAIGALAIGLLLLVNHRVSGLQLRLWLPAVIAAAGLALLWSQADASERSRLVPASGAGRHGRLLTVLRVVGGVALVVVALLTFLVGSGRQTAIGESLLLLLVVALGLGLVVGPFLWRLVRQLDAERRERLLTQQQADVAAHLHDSVLQTLALIQRKADDPRAVVALARAQERDLRGWLFESAAEPETTVRAALDIAAAEVEQAHGTPVEVVVVGDCPLDEARTAVVRAAREAMVNAARHSGAPVVDVFAECAPERLEVFVRDRGSGFDPRTVPPDRMGLAGSVIGRMERHGGSARIRSAPDEGTEVALSMPAQSTPGQSTPSQHRGGRSADDDEGESP